MKKSVESKLRFNNRLTFWSLWILIVILITCQTVYNMDLREEIDSMPHYECWNETIEETIKVEPYKPTPNVYVFYGRVYGSGCFIDDYDEVLCEDGIDFYECTGYMENRGNETKTCITKRTEKFCKLNHDVNLGADE